MMKRFSLLLLFTWCLSSYTKSRPLHATSYSVAKNRQNQSNASELKVVKCIDFSVTGKGDNAAWRKAKWNVLTRLDSGANNYESKFKMLYSSTGVYVLFSGVDDKITTNNYNDFEALYNGDVFEVFFHPVASAPPYFEYEINQLDKELILMLTQQENKMYSWAPKYPMTSEQKPIKKMVEVVGGPVEINGNIKSWTAEIYFPFTFLGLLPNVPPSTGTVWDANFCRLDYDGGKMIKYSWSSGIKKSFHELSQFRSIRFE